MLRLSKRSTPCPPSTTNSEGYSARTCSLPSTWHVVIFSSLCRRTEKGKRHSSILMSRTIRNSDVWLDECAGRISTSQESCFGTIQKESGHVLSRGCAHTCRELGGPHSAITQAARGSKESESDPAPQQALICNGHCQLPQLLHCGWKFETWKAKATRHS